MPTKHTCCWVLHNAAPGVKAEYCGAPVSYRIVRDDDENRMRRYNPFCARHQEAANQQDDDDFSR